MDLKRQRRARDPQSNIGGSSTCGVRVPEEEEREQGTDKKMCANFHLAKTYVGRFEKVSGPHGQTQRKSHLGTS